MNEDSKIKYEEISNKNIINKQQTIKKLFFLNDHYKYY